MSRHVLIYEPRIEGHHLTWLGYVIEDLLAGGYRLTVALDTSAAASERIEAKLGRLLPQVTILPAAPNVKRAASRHLLTCARLLAATGADHIFFPCLDEITSHVTRRAFFGFFPPAELHGKMSGIFLRPRFLANPVWPPKETIKGVGFKKLLKRGWFHRILLLDETLVNREDRKQEGCFDFIPEPFSGSYPLSKTEARTQAGLPQDRVILLHYGISSRRKGLHLTVRALNELSPGHRPFLLCAGPPSDDPEIREGLAALEKSGDARVVGRYIYEDEETLYFCTADIVLLTYIRHFGSSAVLSRAAAAGKMVIASNEELTGRRVLENKLGLLFPSGNETALKHCLQSCASLKEEEFVPYQIAGARYTERYSRSVFRTAVQKACAA